MAIIEPVGAATDCEVAAPALVGGAVSSDVKKIRK
jgi:hypothetical protein